MATNRFDILSTSTSGVSYVREKRGGIMRALTESELADFNDPPPCPACGEQFGCDHLNIAGEPMLTEAEIESEVPAEWTALAKSEGLSRGDIDRLRSLEPGEAGYRAGPGGDLRTMELVLLLNDEKSV